MIGLILQDIVDKSNVHVQSSATLGQVIEVMNANQRGVIVVVENDKPAGIVTERDIIKFLYNGIDLNEEVGKYAGKRLVTIKSDRTVFYALALMIENNIRRLVVVDEAGGFMGVLIQKDLIKYLEEDFYRLTIRVKHILKNMRPLISLQGDGSLKDVLKEMVAYGISGVPIVEEGTAVGIITEKDILRLLNKNISLHEPVSGFMSAPVITAGLETPLPEVVRVMNEKNTRRAVIIDEKSLAVGIITDRDLLRNLEGDYTDFIERKLRHTKDILNLLPEMLLEIIDTGEEQFVIWANEKAVGEFGKGIVDSPITDLIPPEKWVSIHETLLKCKRIEDVRFMKDDHVFEFSGFFIRTDVHSERGRIQLVVRDITEDIKLYMTDPLTGLYNRRFLNEFLVKEVEISKRLNKRFSIAIADLDGFKEVNDTFGHLSGDAVLKTISGIMVKEMRKADVVGRYGGEELVIIMPETAKEIAARALERVRERIAHAAIGLPDGNTVTVTASFGLASFPEDGASQVDLLIAADDRLYKAKREGKNRIVFH